MSTTECVGGKSGVVLFDKWVRYVKKGKNHWSVSRKEQHTVLMQGTICQIVSAAQSLCDRSTWTRPHTRPKSSPSPWQTSWATLSVTWLPYPQTTTVCCELFRVKCLTCFFWCFFLTSCSCKRPLYFAQAAISTPGKMSKSCVKLLNVHLWHHIIANVHLWHVIANAHLWHYILLEAKICDIIQLVCWNLMWL